MNTCHHCGESFKPKYPRQKLCYPCWLEREHAFELVAELRAENASLRRSSEPAAGSIPRDIHRLMLSLCHPDRHGNSPSANRVTVWLLKNAT